MGVVSARENKIQGARSQKPITSYIVFFISLRFLFRVQTRSFPKQSIFLLNYYPNSTQ
jgi:hypothetical protein